jgi:phosphatidylinositol alpha-mannosyltransferase
MRIVLAHGGDLGVPSGGNERVVAFAAGLESAGHDVALITVQPTGALPDRLAGVEIRAVDVPTGGLRTQPRRALAVARTARRTANRRDARLQVAHSTLARVASLVGANSYVLDMYDVAFTSPLYRDRPLGGALATGIRWVEGRGIRAAGDVIVVSERMGSFVRETWGIPSDRITVVPNGYFEADIEGVEPETGPGMRVVFVGTLHPKLDVDAVAESARLESVDELLVVVGGAVRAELARVKRERGLDAVSLLGHLSTDRTWSLVAGADVAINPQRQSPTQAVSSPVKLCYYRALGVPMVLSDGPALAREFAEAGIARLVGTEDVFADELDKFLTDIGELETMRSRAARTVGCGTWAEQARSFQRVYQHTS